MVGLWLTIIEAGPDDARFRSLAGLVSPEKRERLARMRPGSAVQSLYAELLLRILACEALGVSNGALRFAAGERGKPFLPDFPDFHFNAAHTEGAVAAAISDCPVGVDVERTGRASGHDIARRFFTPQEREYIGAGPEAGRRFCEVWTRKEAWIKRDGGGLAVPLGSFDTLSGMPARETSVYEPQGFVAALCAAGARPESVTLLPEAELWRRAQML